MAMQEVIVLIEVDPTFGPRWPVTRIRPQAQSKKNVLSDHSAFDEYGVYAS